jgi:hypothetical protein
VYTFVYFPGDNVSTRNLILIALFGLVGCGSQPLRLPFGDAGAGRDGGTLPFGDAGQPSDGGASDGGVPADGGLAEADGGAGDAGTITDGGATDGGVADGGGPDAGLLPDAEVVGTDVPLRLRPAEARTVHLTLRNTGNVSWSAPDFALGSMNDPVDAWGATVASLAAPVAPQATHTFDLAVTAPGAPGLHRFHWKMRWGASPFGAEVDVPVEVTCDDGTFCNGVERFSGGSCVAGPPPCDDGVACTTDSCDEGIRRCAHTPATSGCAECSACAGDCTGRACGDDGCGRSCGSCGSGESCHAGVCEAPGGPGTCSEPFPLTPSGRQILTGDTSLGFHQIAPTCAAESTAPERVYTFTLTEATAMDAQVVGFDTVLSLRTECARSSSTIACNDDANPPGWPGSRIARVLEPGTYFLVVDGYNQSARGPYTLTVTFTAGRCLPSCDGRFCGPDGCGGSCGTCITGECGSDGHCLDPCARACEGKECGDNGCGGSCGTCGQGTVCTSGRCLPGVACDHFRPTCSPACGDGEFCGTDCVCRPVDAPLPDLVVSQRALVDTQQIVTEFFRTSACAVSEGCVRAAGWRRLLRFEVRSANLGQVDLDFGAPSARPSLYEWSPCHRHFHFRGFAEYELRDATGRTVVLGRKQAFCLEDIARAVDSPAVSCSAKYTCSRQGIQRGWTDVYRASLDCQWLDITDVPSGEYRLVVRVNPLRIIQELTLDNNEAAADVTIP